jgi:DNA repair exonuclease SbcCD nuclease subunit
MSIQILHCADLHLDKVFSIRSMAKRERRQQDLIDNLEIMVERAKTDRPDFFLIAGDTYDKVNPSNHSRNVLARSACELKSAGVAMVIIGGNHDVPKFGRRTLAIETLQSAGLATVFAQQENIICKTFSVDGQKVCIGGRSYDTKGEGKNPLENQKMSDIGRFNILILHASFLGRDVKSVIPEDEGKNPIRETDVKRQGLDYLALGHYHNYFQKSIGETTVVNPGSIEKMTFYEHEDEKSYVWAEIDEEGVEIERVKLPTRPMQLLETELDKKTPSPTKKIIESLQEYSDPDKIVRLTVSGEISADQYLNLDLRKAYNALSDKFFELRIDRSQLEVEGFGKVFIKRVDTPRIAYEKRIEGMIRTAETEPQKDFLRRVRQKGVQYLEAAQE